MIFGIIIGVVLGYLFKPQIDNALKAVAKRLSDKRRDDDNTY